MAFIGTKDKKEIIEKYRTHDKDQGSSEVQIALLTERINHLVAHLKIHKKDHHTRRGLLIMVGQRERHLRYLKKQNTEQFAQITQKLGLKVKAAENKYADR